MNIYYNLEQIIYLEQHFCQWVLGWGNQIEVLTPLELRDQIKDMAKSVLNIYSE